MISAMPWLLLWARRCASSSISARWSVLLRQLSTRSGLYQMADRNCRWSFLISGERVVTAFGPTGKAISYAHARSAQHPLDSHGPNRGDPSSAADLITPLRA